MKNQNGELVDNLIFEVYKDKIIINASRFREQVQKDYGFIPSSDLYRKIINYQINKYGTQLDEHVLPTTKYFSQWGLKNRTRTLERNKEKAKLEGMIKRNEKSRKHK